MGYTILGLVMIFLVTGCGSASSRKSDASWTRYASAVESMRPRAATGARAVVSTAVSNSCDLDAFLRSKGCPVPEKPRAECLPPIPSPEEMEAGMKCLQSGGDPRECLPEPPKPKDACLPPRPESVPSQCWNVLANFASSCAPEKGRDS